MAIEFWCVECGQKHTAERVQAGREIACTRCRMMIRVPLELFTAGDDTDVDNPRSVSNATGHIVLEPEHVAAGFASIRLFEFSLVLFGCAIAALSVALIFALDQEGLDGLITWNWKLSTTVIATGFGIAVAVLLVGTLFRGIAYHQLRHLDRFFGGGSALAAAQCGLALQALAGIIFFGGTAWATASYSLLFSFLLCGVTGLAVEFAGLAALQRLLLQTGGPRFVEGIRRYVVVFCSTLFGGLTFIALPGVVLYSFYSPQLSHPARLAFVLALAAFAILACLTLLGYSWHRVLMTTYRQLQLSSPTLAKTR